MRSADERLVCCRSLSIAATSPDKVVRRLLAISFSPDQNASSRLTLVLWPATTMERLTTSDFMKTPPQSSPDLAGMRALMLRLNRGLGPVSGCRCFNALQIRGQGRVLH